MSDPRCSKCKGPTVVYIPLMGPSERICADEAECVEYIAKPFAVAYPYSAPSSLKDELDMLRNPTPGAMTQALKDELDMLRREFLAGRLTAIEYTNLYDDALDGLT